MNSDEFDRELLQFPRRGADGIALQDALSSIQGRSWTSPLSVYHGPVATIDSAQLRVDC